MFGLSMWEIVIIALVILFVVGPKRLPDVAKSIGKGYGEFKRTFNEMKQSVNVNDNSLKINGRTNQNNNQINSSKIQSYSEQYKSQWEEKFDNIDDNPKLSKLETTQIESNIETNISKETAPKNEKILNNIEENSSINVKN